MPSSWPASPATPTTSTRSERRSRASSRFAQDAVYPYGAGGPNASFALLDQATTCTPTAPRARISARYAWPSATTRCAIPHALMKKTLTLDEYLSARPIADPIHLFDCVMPCAGAEAFLVCREAAARALGLRRARAAVHHRAAQCLRRRSDPDARRLGGGCATSCGRRPALRRRTSTSCRPTTTIPSSSMMQFEDLGFCEKGEAPEFVRAHTLTNDGSFPHNTSRRPAVGRPGRRGRRLPGLGRGDPAADRHGAWHAGARRQPRPRVAASA